LLSSKTVKSGIEESLTGFCNLRTVGKLCSDGYHQPVFTPEDKHVGTHPG